jgi:hypothetical protein
MKRIITLLAALTITSAAYSQTVITPDTKEGNPDVSIAGFDISIGDDNQQTKKKANRITTNIAGLSFGANMITHKPNYGNWENEANFLSDHTASWRFELEALGMSISLNKKQNVFFKVALNSSFDTFRFKKPFTLVNEENGVLMTQEITGNVKKTKMVNTYLGIGTGLGFKVSSVLFMFDFKTDILTSSYVKYKNPHKTKYGVSGANNIRYRTGISATFDGFGIFADYCFTPIFRNGVGNDGTILTIGACCGF